MYLVSYDIAPDKVRNKIAKALLNYGRRVQYSVFECDIDSAMYRKMYRELVTLMKDVSDSNIRIYILDKKAENKTVLIGTPASRIPNDKDTVFFI